MLKFVRFMILFALLVSISQSMIWADESISLRHNGMALKLPAPVMIDEGRSIIPIRTAFEIVGLNVDWDAASQTAIGFKGDYRISVKLNEETAIINGVSHPLDVPAQLIENRVYVPLRFISESLGADIKWDDRSKTIDVYTHFMKTPAYITEPHLKEALLRASGKAVTDDLTQGDLLYILKLDLSSQDIATIDGINLVKNLRELNLGDNDISNLRPLEDLEYIETLILNNNNIKSIYPLVSLSTLKNVDLRNNEIDNIEAIQQWPALETLLIAGNKLDQDEELSPLYYLKDQIKVDVNTDLLEKPERNTWNLRSDAPAFKMNVAENVYWIPANEMGISTRKNEDIPELLQNTPSGRAVQIQSLYDLLQYIQHTEFHIVSDDSFAIDKERYLKWAYVKSAENTLMDNSGSYAALANASAYILSQEYDESGIIVLKYKTGEEKILNFLMQSRAYDVRNEDDEKEVAFKNEYAVFDVSNYLKGANPSAAIEDGTVFSYNRSGGIKNNIHLTTDLNAFIKAYSDTAALSAAYSIKYVGDANSYFPSATYTEGRGGEDQYLFLPKSALLEKDDEDYLSNPIETYYTLLYDDPNDRFLVKRMENKTGEPTPRKK